MNQQNWSSFPPKSFSRLMTFSKRRLEKEFLVMVAQYKRLLIPKEVLQRTFAEYLALPQNIEEDA